MVYGQFLSNLGPLTLTADEISVSVPVRLMQKASTCSDLQRQRQTYCNTKQGPLYSCPSVLPAINHQDEPHACWRQAGTHKEETFSAQTKQICCDQLDGSRVRKLAAQWMWRMSYQFVCLFYMETACTTTKRQTSREFFKHKSFKRWEKILYGTEVKPSACSQISVLLCCSLSS